MLFVFALILILLFPLLNHPLSMGLNILILTILFSVSMSMEMSNTWISYALVLVLLGGLLVIFIYVSLLASNELFKSNNYTFILISSVVFLFTLFFLLTNLHEFSSSSSNFRPFQDLNLQNYEWLSQLYSLELWSLTSLLIMYLLLTLIAVVSITKNDFSSLRSLK
uniref:NADH dehydrogenase subunit 6 n=1 Tax=Ceriodaphnia cornuta TaxID=1255123 RepID=UPI0022380E6A|nr:NADH dehydrogenase subunit 6 [Ceriodaphnia cornuta]UYS92825.1 NADH dehydrogenase subunit 6 [Ceriodaphnia cornuta]